MYYNVIVSNDTSIKRKLCITLRYLSSIDTTTFTTGQEPTALFSLSHTVARHFARIVCQNRISHFETDHEPSLIVGARYESTDGTRRIVGPARIARGTQCLWLRYRPRTR